MKHVVTVLLLCLSFTAHSQSAVRNFFKFATFYSALNGATALADDELFFVEDGGLGTSVVTTPFDYSATIGIRKIQRFGYENRGNQFYNGTENSYSDAATIGRRNGFEFLFEADYKRRLGQQYIDQNHFLRYVAESWLAKVEYVQDGFADIRYFESTQRARMNINGELSLNAGFVQRLSEPYGYNPLDQWTQGPFHYTYLALEQGYNVEWNEGQATYLNPDGEVLTTSTDVWEEVIIPDVLKDYVEQERNNLPNQWSYSAVVGFDYYNFKKDKWLHAWGNVMPYHLESGEYSYGNFIDGDQWIDYSGGLIFGYNFNKHLGIFAEGTYNKYWNRSWHNFSLGVNYVFF